MCVYKYGSPEKTKEVLKTVQTLSREEIRGTRENRPRSNSTRPRPPPLPADRTSKWYAPAVEQRQSGAARVRGRFGETVATGAAPRAGPGTAPAEAAAPERAAGGATAAASVAQRPARAAAAAAATAAAAAAAAADVDAGVPVAGGAAARRRAVRQRAARHAGRPRLPGGLDRRPRVVQQGARGPEVAAGRHGAPAGVQGDRQAARRGRRLVVRGQVLAARAAAAVRGPAPERDQDPPDIRDPVHRARVHGLLRGGRPAQPPAAQQGHTAVAGAHVLQVSASGVRLTARYPVSAPVRRRVRSSQLRENCNATKRIRTSDRSNIGRHRSRTFASVFEAQATSESFLFPLP